MKKELSAAQYNAVTYINGPELVIAGAGSGKTRVLTYKIAYLIKNGYIPNQILALTFTNKAAKEMKERICGLIKKEYAKKVVMGTFHSIFGKILRYELNLQRGILPYTPKFTIYDTDDSEKVIKEIVDTLHLDPKVYTPSTVLSRISKAKNNMITYTRYPETEMLQADKERKIDNVFEIYEKYQKALIDYNAMDFDDFLLNTYLLFRDNDSVRSRYAKHFKYCLVDEYQDTNLIQKAILLQLTKESKMLCAVGDDAQSIYGFRGAIIQNILNYQKDYPGAVIFKLEENYRSTQTIVNAANSVIKKNRRQIFKNCYSNNTEGEKIKLFRGSTDRFEAQYVINTIKEKSLAHEYNYNDFTILYRSNWLSRSFEETLRKESIPYKIFGGMSFYQRKEIKDLLAYFRIVVNPDDEQALRRIINYPTRGIGATTLQKLVEQSISSGKNLWNIIATPYNYAPLFPKGTVNKILDFVHLIKKWQHQQHLDAYELASIIVKESGVAKTLKNSLKEEDLEKYENVEELLTGIKTFVEDHQKDEKPSISLDDYIREVSLFTDEDKDNDNETSCVRLMTIHASKGLEFPVVFIVGMDEDVFPSRLSDSTAALEEERRLFYVAITRAKQLCYLTGAENRFKNGSYSTYDSSPFIRDIDPRYIRY